MVTATATANLIAAADLTAAANARRTRNPDTLKNLQTTAPIATPKAATVAAESTDKIS
jgi:hypothetical protein